MVRPDALGGALEVRSEYTGRTWSSSGRLHHGHTGGDFDGGGGGESGGGRSGGGGDE